MSSEYIKGFIASRRALSYPTYISKPAPTPEDVFIAFYKKRPVMSPRQMDMLNYHTSIEQPSLLEELEKSLNISK